MLYETGWVGVTGGALAGQVHLNLWSATRKVRLRELVVVTTSSSVITGDLWLVRTTARGTQTATITPTLAANTIDPNESVGPTLVFDNAWSVQPTFAAIPLRRTDIAAAQGSAFYFNWEQDAWEEVGASPVGGIALLNNSASTHPLLRGWLRWME